MKRSAAPALLLLPLSVLLTACQQAPTGGTYSTGGDPADEPCARVVSVIGYAGLLLEPEGREEEQNFEDAVLGRLAEVRGTTLQFGPRLPSSLAPAVSTVQEATRTLSTTEMPHGRQVALLKQYRSAAAQIEEGCA